MSNHFDMIVYGHFVAIVFIESVFSADPNESVLILLNICDIVLDNPSAIVMCSNQKSGKFIPLTWKTKKRIDNIIKFVFVSSL